MEDHLSLVITQSVTPHFKDFEIFRVPISGRPGASVLVVAFQDSYAAPFQSNFGPNYFWRLPGSIQPAPHFHLELLRNRVTRAAVRIEKIEHYLQDAKYDQNLNRMYARFDFILSVENVSMQSATAWGIKIQSDRCGWFSSDVQKELASGVCVHGAPAVLLPSEQVRVRLQIETRVSTLREWEYFDTSFLPVSQNFVGESVRVQFPSDTDKFIAMRELRRQLGVLGFNVDQLMAAGLC
jgi:hypothetical protein